MIILDPEREGCHVYNGHYMSYIHGNPQEVCSQLYQRLGYIEIIETPQYGVEKHYVQNINVRLDPMGIGRYYLDSLRDMGIRVETLQLKDINISLPIQTPIDRREVSFGKFLHKD